MREKQIEYFDEDFLGNKINIGDKVIFQAPDYRMFTIGEVITKAKKSCQIEYLNTWNFPGEGRKLMCRQGYDQIIKQSEGEWEKRDFIIFDFVKTAYRCTSCNTTWDAPTKFCPNCGAKMKGE